MTVASNKQAGRIVAWLVAVSMWCAVAQAQQASRAAGAGCKWKQWEDESLGVSMLVQDCDGGSARAFIPVGNTVRKVSPGQDPSRGAVVIEVFDKPEKQKMQQAIEQRIFANLNPRQKAGCEIVLMDDRPLADSAKQAWYIAPTSVYRAEADKMRSEDAGAEVCGPFGELDVKQYFEYHPAESKTRFLFVRLARYERMFDEQSIRILNPR